MTITLLLLIVVFVLAIIFFKKIQWNRVFGSENRLVQELKNTKWFHNYWLSGLVLFVINAVLFSLTCFLLYLMTIFSIPFIHLLVMIGAVVGSIFIWFMFHHAWEGSKRNRLKMGTIGSSIYFILSILLLHWSVTIEPVYPGEDIFMRWIGIMFALIVTITAFLTCFFIIGFSGRKNPAT